MLNKVYIIGLIAISIAVVVSTNEIDIEKLKSQLPEGIIPEGFNASSLPTADDAKKLFKEKCEKTSKNEEAFQQAENAAEVFRDCVMGLIDFETLQKEIDAAQPNGDLDTVFNKYCRKRTIAVECLNNFTIAIEPCLNEEEIKQKTTIVKIFTNLLNFVCHKDGDQIALFIAEKGPECFNANKDNLINCINQTMSSYIPKEPTVNTLPQFVLGVDQCNDMGKMQRCIVKELETCEESTPANLVDSMFKFIRNETPCADVPLPATMSETKSSDAGKTSMTIITTAVVTLTASLLL